jgi:hypothetical protein
VIYMGADTRYSKLAFKASIQNRAKHFYGRVSTAGVEYWSNIEYLCGAKRALSQSSISSVSNTWPYFSHRDTIASQVATFSDCRYQYGFAMSVQFLETPPLWISDPTIDSYPPSHAAIKAIRPSLLVDSASRSQYKSVSTRRPSPLLLPRGVVGHRIGPLLQCRPVDRVVAKQLTGAFI